MDGLDHGFGFSPEPNTALVGASGSWSRLARAVGTLPETEAVELARLINQSQNRFSLGSELYTTLRELVLDPPYDALGPAEGYQRASHLIEGLQTSLLATALSSQTNLGDRKTVIAAAIKHVSPAAVQALAEASGAAFDRPISMVLKALLVELKTESETLPMNLRPKAEASFRSLVHHMVERWASTTVDTSATGYEHLFEDAPEESTEEVVAPEAIRVVQLALEIGAVGSIVWGAVAELSKGDGMRALLGMLKAAPADSKAAQMISQQFANPQRLSMLLREEPVDFDAVDPLLRHMGTAAAETLLDELVAAHSRAVRRGILDRLCALGPEIGPQVMDRLKDDRWFVTRNMLHVLNETGADLGGLSLAQYQTHADARVRREAMALLLKDPVGRDRALASSFKDTDSFMIRAALKAAKNGLPDVAVPVLAKRIHDPDFPPEFRVPSIHLLGHSKSMLALDALLKFAQGRNSMLGKPKLAAKSPEMLAAMRGLSLTWPAERRAKVLLELASGSKDSQIAAAVESAESGKEIELDD